MPQLADIASIEAETFRLLPSPEVTFPDLFALADAIEQAVADGAQGAVVTHGTDTMEESAFVLDRILTLDAPVVLTGAMRNPTLAGPDGPANLLNSVRLAVHEPARGLGVMVVMNDEIHRRALRAEGRDHRTPPPFARCRPGRSAGSRRARHA